MHQILCGRNHSRLFIKSWRTLTFKLVFFSPITPTTVVCAFAMEEKCKGHIEKESGNVSSYLNSLSPFLPLVIFYFWIVMFISCMTQITNHGGSLLMYLDQVRLVLVSVFWLTKRTFFQRWGRLN